MGHSWNQTLRKWPEILPEWVAISKVVVNAMTDLFPKAHRERKSISHRTISVSIAMLNIATGPSINLSPIIDAVVKRNRDRSMDGHQHVIDISTLLLAMGDD